MTGWGADPWGSGMWGGEPAQLELVVLEVCEKWSVAEPVGTWLSLPAR